VTTPKAVRVVTEVSAVDKSFDYAITPATEHVGLGDRVRVNFNGRSVRGWVSEFVEPERELKELVKWLGYGPPPELTPLLAWAARRWVASVSRFYLATSPPRIITDLPTPPKKIGLTDVLRELEVPLVPGVTRVAPSVDPLGIVLHAYETSRHREGSLLVLVPTEGWAQRLRGRLAQRGLAVACGDGEWDRMRASWPIIIGTRGDAFAPTPRLCAAVVIDADDSAFRSEASPTYHATEVVLHRAQLDEAPVWLCSALPSPALLGGSETCAVARDEVAGWPAISVIDRRGTDPRDGVLSSEVLDAVHHALRGGEEVAVAIVLQRLGTGRLFGCRSCGDLARCEICAAPEAEAGSRVTCPNGHGERESFCRSCGSTQLKKIRSGVTTLARDVTLQLGQAVDEVTATTKNSPLTARVVVGTEAIFSRVRRCSLVVFVDFDQYLLAPRERARREGILAVAKAGRLVGARSEGRGSVMLQTRRGDDKVLQSLVAVDLTPIQVQDVIDARELEIPPFVARAEISGESAAAFVASITASSVAITSVDEVFTVTAATHEELSTALLAAVRPPGRLRLAIE